MRIGLVGCVKSKRSVAAPAADLYVSALFRGRRAYVERTCDRWFILSAKHGLVLPEQVLEPYDLAMSSLSLPQRRKWSGGVLSDLARHMPTMRGQVFEIHAGAPYRNHGLVGGIEAAGGLVENPTLGMNQGRQLQFYAAARAVRRQVDEHRVAANQTGSPPPTAWSASQPAPKRRVGLFGSRRRRGGEAGC